MRCLPELPPEPPRRPRRRPGQRPSARRADRDPQKPLPPGRTSTPRDAREPPAALPLRAPPPRNPPKGRAPPRTRSSQLLLRAAEKARIDPLDLPSKQTPRVEQVIPDGRLAAAEDFGDLSGIAILHLSQNEGCL